MTTTERPAPALTQCPSWCQEPAGHPWEPAIIGDVDGPLARYHVHGGGDVELRMTECTDDEWTRAGDYGRAYVEFFNHDHFSIDTAAQVSLDAAEAVWTAVDDPETCSEDTPAIRRVLAERAVLDAVRAWVEGGGTTLAIESAYGALAAALAEEVER